AIFIMIAKMDASIFCYTVISIPYLIFRGDCKKGRYRLSNGNMAFIRCAHFSGRFSTNPALNPDNHNLNNDPCKEEP
ncbi:MAG: hypothetical protein U9N82_07345, partial [Thermodesulfobacteriota bacterium]|nr:hypothetical protein [Thermodesulfobacteriota bacterium]